MDMVLDEFLLGVADGFLDGVQLLRQIHARPARLQHVDDGRKVSLGALQPRANLGKLMHCTQFHIALSYPPRQDMGSSIASPTRWVGLRSRRIVTKDGQ